MEIGGLEKVSRHSGGGDGNYKRGPGHIPRLTPSRVSGMRRQSYAGTGHIIIIVCYNDTRRPRVDKGWILDVCCTTRNELTLLVQLMKLVG